MSSVEFEKKPDSHQVQTQVARQTDRREGASRPNLVGDGDLKWADTKEGRVGQLELGEEGREGTVEAHLDLDSGLERDGGLRAESTRRGG